VADGATPESPARRRSSWSLRAIVQDVAGRPIDDFQEPGKPTHPYVKMRGEGGTGPSRSGAPASEPEETPYDPVGHFSPPLVGAHGREVHGPEHEHHAETLARHPSVPAGVGEKPRGPGPSNRPERLYLHYLLLHLDRLNDSSLAYLRSAVEEELAHRARPLAPRPAPPAPPPASAPPTPEANASPPPLPIPAE
jgi:hypothetical protein